MAGFNRMQTTITQVIQKENGLGPYFYVLTYTYDDGGIGDTMVCVFSSWEDLHAHREALAANGIKSQWDLGVDRTRRPTEWKAL